MRIWILMMLSTTLAFGQTKPADTVQRCQSMLAEAAQDKNPDVRKRAAEALSLVGVKDNALQSLAPMLDDHDVSVRIAVVITLGDFKDNRTLPLLKKALQDPVPEVDFAAAKVLYQMHDPDGVQFLLAVVSGESKASSSYLSKEKRSALRMLHTPTKLFTYIAIQAAGFAPVPGLGFGLSSAQGILSDPDSSARAASLLLIEARMIQPWRMRWDQPCRTRNGQCALRPSTWLRCIPSQYSGRSWSPCWTTRRMRCANAPPRPTSDCSTKRRSCRRGEGPGLINRVLRPLSKQFTLTWICYLNAQRCSRMSAMKCLQ